MRVLAGIYIVGCLLWVAIWIIRKADRHFWRGIFQGGLIAIAYTLFICAISYLTWGPIWR